MLRIDKSKFNAEQLAQYEELMAIGKADVDTEGGEEDMEDQKPPIPKTKEEKSCSSPKKTKKAEVDDNMEDTKKSAEEVTSDALAEVQKELAEFKKSVEIQKFVEMAKKYAPLGKKEEELGPQLYNMKKSDEAAYNTFVGVLDEHLDLVNKSGMFGEIGKSAGAYGSDGGSVQDKIAAKAAEIRKANPDIDYTQSIAKAWEQNPDLFDEYDKEYSKG